jgi:hypothetical protein
VLPISTGAGDASADCATNTSRRIGFAIASKRRSASSNGATTTMGHHYYEVRPHSSLGYLTLPEFKATDVATLTERRSPATPAHADQEEQRTETRTLINQPTGAILQ